MSKILKSILRGRMRVAVHASAWALIFITFFFLLSGATTPEEAMRRTAVNTAFMVALFYGNAKLLVNPLFEQGRYRLLIGLSLLLLVGAAALRTWLEFRIFGIPLITSKLPEDSKELRMFAFFALNYFLLLIFSALYQLMENRHNLEMQHQALEARHAEAQLNYLKAQINPHFLFNTLHNIYASATLQHPETPQMVLKLSALLRYVIYECQNKQVPLAKELEHIREYIDLFQMKSEVPMNVQFEVRGAVAEREIEPMLLIPLVENALKHGDLGENPASYLKISLEVLPDRLLFSLENSVNRSDQQKDEVGGVGMENIRQRLEINYPGRHWFAVAETEEAFSVMLELKT